MFKSRSIRRRPSEEQFPVKVFTKCSAVPWNLRGDGIVDQKFIIPGYSDYLRPVLRKPADIPGKSDSVQEQDITVNLHENAPGRDTGTLSGTKRKTTFK